jgi:hypothetical protein
MAILKWLGIGLIVLWLVLWLALKITSVAIHALVLLGLVMLVVGFFKANTGPR